MHRIGKTGGLWISQMTHKASGDEGLASQRPLHKAYVTELPRPVFKDTFELCRGLRWDALFLHPEITRDRQPRAHGRKNFAPRDASVTNFSPAAAPKEIGSPTCVDLAEMTEIIIGAPRSKRNTGAPEEP